VDAIFALPWEAMGNVLSSVKSSFSVSSSFRADAIDSILTQMEKESGDGIEIRLYGDARFGMCLFLEVFTMFSPPIDIALLQQAQSRIRVDECVEAGFGYGD
jgi:hypothetical protein